MRKDHPFRMTLILVFLTLYILLDVQSNPLQWKHSSGLVGITSESGTCASGTRPCARYDFGVAHHSDSLVTVFGGWGASEHYNDVFGYNPQTNVWRYYRGGYLNQDVSTSPSYAKYPSDTNKGKCNPPPRIGYWESDSQPYGRRRFCMGAIDERFFYMYGGMRPPPPVDNPEKMHDLWYFDTSDGFWAKHSGSFSNVLAPWDPTYKGQFFLPSETAGSRSGHVCQLFENRYILVALGSDVDEWYYDDVYEFDTYTGLWGWMQGTGLYDQAEVQNGQNNFRTINHPRGMERSTMWKKNENEFQLFGGYYYHSIVNRGYLAAIWTYRRSDRMWAWTGGTLSTNCFTEIPSPADATPTYYSSTTIHPGCRADSTSLRMNSDEIWIFGGLADTSFYEQDVFYYQISTNQMKYIAGDIGAHKTGIYSSSYSPTNWPGSRSSMSSVHGKQGEIIMFFGHGYHSGSTGRFSDTWQFMFCQPCGVNAECNELGTCVCLEHYVGNPLTLCTPDCQSNCATHATCVTPPLGCDCNDGYSGDGYVCAPDCTSPPCLPSAFEECIAPNECACIENYSGDPCKPICTNCGANTDCVAPNVCNCTKGYVGDPYSAGCTGSYVCSGGCHVNATCVGTDFCECKNGYFGDGASCSPRCVTPYDCVLNATCLRPDYCVCDGGYTGIGTFECTPICSAGCGVNAECVYPEKCGCGLDYSGDPDIKCFPICNNPSQCVANATCVGPDDCVCDSGFSGIGFTACTPDCTGGCPVDSTCVAPEICKCDTTGFAIGVSGDCEAQCVGNFSCAPSNAECFEPNGCVCIGEYTGDPYVSCELVCVDVCGVDAECIGGFCECRRGYSGDAQVKCYPECALKCGKFANCTSPNECTCNDGYYGPQPNSAWVECFPLCNGSFRCVENAECVAPSTCECNENYVGVGNERCDPVCAPPCHVNAECFAELQVCRCDDGFTGDGRTCVGVGSAGGGSVAGPIIGVTFGVLGLICVVGVFVLCVVGVLLGVYLHKRNKKMKEMERIIGNSVGRTSSMPGTLGNAKDMLLGETPGNEEGGEIAEYLRQIGDRIGDNVFVVDYDEVNLVREIGDGGSNSKVFQADWDGRIVAFKLFKTKILSGKEDLEEFQRELMFVSALSHPNIIQFFGVVLRPPRLGIIMEFCARGDLPNFIEMKNETNRPLRFNQKLNILKDVASALNYIHKREIMHRDMKAKNILIKEPMCAKVIDFGLSKVKVQDDNTVTKRIGTSNYMAPEVTLGEDYNKSCDVFSFSIVCWEIFSESFDPYDTKNHKFIVEFKVAQNPTFRPKMGATFCRQIEDHMWLMRLIKDCWAHDKDDRPEFKEIVDSMRSRSYRSDVEPQKPMVPPSLSKKPASFRHQRRTTEPNSNFLRRGRGRSRGRGMMRGRGRGNMRGRGMPRGRGRGLMMRGRGRGMMRGRGNPGNFPPGRMSDPQHQKRLPPRRSPQRNQMPPNPQNTGSFSEKPLLPRQPMHVRRKTIEM